MKSLTVVFDLLSLFLPPNAHRFLKTDDHIVEFGLTGLQHYRFFHMIVIQKEFESEKL